MIRYYFNFFDGALHQDTVGTALPSLSEARVQAIGLMGEMLRRDPDAFQSADDWRIELADGHGQVLFSIGASFEATEDPGH